VYPVTVDLFRHGDKRKNFIYLFTFTFKKPISDPDCTTSKNSMMILMTIIRNNELETMCKEVVVA
jgi:hypothetical protein